MLALVATLGGMEALPDDEPGTATVPTATATEEEGFLSKLGSAARGLVDPGPRKARPEVVGAGLAMSEKPPAAKKWPPQKRVRELTGKRTANSRTYQLSDGRTQSEISATPLHYRDAKGKLQPIDTTVRPITEKGYVQGNRTNAFTSLFGDSSDELARFEQDGRSIELGLAGAAKSVTPKVSGSTVTYPGLAGGADIVYDVTSTALKEKIVLHRAPAGPASYTFTLDTAGLTAQQRADGSIAFVPRAGGEPAFVMPAPFMYDAKDDKASPVGKVWSDKVTQTVTQSGGRSTVTVTADAGWLADPARVYPVVVDPTIKVQPVPTDAQDVQIYSADPTHAYGQDTIKWPLHVGTSGSGKWRSLVKFDTSSIPANTAVDDARLEMYYSQTHTAWQYDVPIEARRVTAAWDEDTATWNSISGSVDTGPAGNFVSVDDGNTGSSAQGTWTASTSTLTSEAVGTDYRVNQDAVAGETYTWTPTLTESGDYKVEVHYVGASDRTDTAKYTVHSSGGKQTPYTIDQRTPASKGAWKTLGIHHFDAGTTGKVVLSDVANEVVIADAVRFSKQGAVKDTAKSGAWLSFPVRSVVQQWVNRTQPNHGFSLQAKDEATLGRGGPIFEASEYAYLNDRRDYNLPKLIVTWGRPGVAVNPPDTVTSTGALLTWPAYSDPTPTTTDNDDIAEYQVHRSVHQNFTPSAETLIAPVSSATRSYQDTTAVPTAADNTDPMARKFYYYMVAVKTRSGQLFAGPTQPVMLPKAGQITRIYRTGVTDTTLAQGRSTENVDVYDGDPYVSPGNNSTYYGDTRGLVKFPALAGIPTNAQIVDADLRMYNTYLYPGTDRDEYVDVYRLTKGFTETKATWNSYDGTNLWSTPGGDYDTSWKASFNGFSNDPEWETWDVTTAVKGWYATPASNYGFLLRQRDEVNQTARAMLLSSEGEEPLLRPTLEVTYLEQTAESTYYAASTPQTLTPNATYTLPVTVSNPTLAAWNTTDWELSYDWKRYNAAGVLEDVPDETYELRTALPKNVVASGTVEVNAQVKTPPSSTDGNKRTEYVLSWDLRNKLNGTKLSSSSVIKGLPQNVAVEEPTSDQLGLEKFYSYAGKNTGAGGTLMNNLYAGNTVWSYNALNNPSRGLSTFVRMSYNSLDTSDSVAGFGWSLQASSMMRLGTPLDFHPNPNPTKVTLTDGDGTSHWFTWDAATNEWKSPKGVNLYLEKVTALDCKPNTQERRAWRLTKPDRTQFYYDCEGFLSSVVDNNGNEMLFTYEERKSNNKPTKFLRYLTDAAGRKTLTIDYYAKGQAYDYINDTTWARTSATNLTNPKIIDHVSQITDISGRKLTFTYTDKGLLGELIDGAGSTNGAPKVFKFRYDMTQGNKNVKLVKVTDPRGNATDLTYHYPQTGDDPKWHWRTKSYTDRLGHPTQFGYVDPDATNNIRTTITDAENHATAYLQDGYGRPIETTNAKSETTKLGWDDDHNVTRIEEANGAVSTWTYDAKTGYPTEIKDAEAVKNGTSGTVLAYQRQLNGYVADLTEKTSPEERKHTFGYEADGDLAWVVDPMGNTTADPEDYKTSYTYDAWGQQLTAKDANDNVTTNSSFDANGYPQTITDAETRATKFVYDVRGNVLKVTDALNHDTTQTYDTFGRPLENRVAKDQAAGEWITTLAPKYDQNDNVYESYAPNGAVTKAFYDKADQLDYTLDPVDITGDPERKTSYTYDKVGNLRTTTEPMGNLTTTVGDYTTTNGYDEIYQLISVTNAKSEKITYEYNNVGDVRKVVDPRKNATADPLDYTTLYEYDKAHRVTKITDALGKFITTRYDRDGVVITTIDQLGNTTEITLDARGKPSQMKVPHKNDAGTITYRTTKHEYDEVGNQTRVISPRGVATTDDPDDFATVNVYDKLNRVKESRTAYDKDDSRYTTADVTTYEYDEVGRLKILSAPPSAGESVRNNTTYTYFDNGWTKTSSDPWDIVTAYEYDDLGAKTTRTLTPAGEDPLNSTANRTMSWTYHPDGKLKSRADNGVPVGKQVVLVDNSDFNNTTATGTWTAATTAGNKYGTNYVTRPAGTGANTFTWQLNVPQAGTYQVFARYPTVTGAATDAKYTVSHGGGNTPKTVNQTTGAGTWVSLGSYNFIEGNSHKVSLSDQATGTIVADAVKMVRDNTGATDDERQEYDYRYDPNGNLKTVTDSSPNTPVDTYTIDYTSLNQVQTVTESKSGAEKNTTSFTYNENSAPLTTTHKKQYSAFEYDARDLVSKVTNGKTPTDPDKKTTTFTYTDRSEKLKETKGNGNTVEHAYYLDGLLKYQAEKKPNGVIVSEHSMYYDLNGNRIKDVNKKMRADDHSAYIFNSTENTYDPRDRLVSMTKTGDTPGAETYVHDANNNVIDQTVNDTRTIYNYDRNRLLTAATGGATASYNYDPFGRLDTVTAAGQVIERKVYDGFDHVIENRKKSSTGTSTTKYTFDPLDRTTTKTTDVGGVKEKMTAFNYLGLSTDVLNEEVAGKVTKSYQYSPWGQRLSQVTHKDDGSEEDAYYGYNPHTDVEQLTDETGNTRATYGYTAYGKNNEAEFTGIDKPEASDPTKEPYNSYRFNSKRWDQNSESYDMGFRDYSPGLNRFLARDSYNGALADMNLGLNAWTGNRYAFGGGNPISSVELDGHDFWGNLGEFVAGAQDGWENWGSDTASGIVSFVKDPVGAFKGMAEESINWSQKYGQVPGTPGGNTIGWGCTLTGACEIYENIKAGKYYEAGYQTGGMGPDLVLGAATMGSSAGISLSIKGLRTAAKAGSPDPDWPNGLPVKAGTALPENPIDLVPSYASRRNLTPHSNGGAQYGVEYSWRQDGQRIRVRIHGPDGTAPIGSNAASGVTYRVQIGQRFMDKNGNLYPSKVHNPKSPNYNPEAANATHIPWPAGVPYPWS
ncbi:DNRLRE domain-containing protein [Micromonospora sp. URMC 105]|uniref:golvesin C-terminal-like domain-containing protein n=1 Tax=Micromonospora sp. URMC 105 TaxID=3423413 RepID=UPI003F1B66D5